jgi:GTP-binding protein
LCFPPKREKLFLISIRRTKRFGPVHESGRFFLVLRFSSLKFLLSAVEIDQFPAANLPEVAFSGRSNVGKSSLLNLLTRRKGLAKVSKTPGKTRALNFFEVDGKWRLVDLPGYGYARLSKAEIEKWGKTIDTYLCERQNLAGVIQLVDSRHKPTDRDLEMLTWLAGMGIPTIVALTKADKIGNNLRRTLPDRFRREWLGNLDWPVVATSAEKGEGRDRLLEEVRNLLVKAKGDLSSTVDDDPQAETEPALVACHTPIRAKKSARTIPVGAGLRPAQTRPSLKPAQTRPRAGLKPAPTHRVTRDKPLAETEASPRRVPRSKPRTRKERQPRHRQTKNRKNARKAP